jgi:hypothetical protein
MTARFAWAAGCWLIAVGTTVATSEPSDAEIEGRSIVQHLLAQRPAENFTNTGTLKIRDAKRQRTEIQVELQTFVTETKLADTLLHARHKQRPRRIADRHSHREPA